MLNRDRFHHQYSSILPRRQYVKGFWIIKSMTTMLHFGYYKHIIILYGLMEEEESFSEVCDSIKVMISLLWAIRLVIQMYDGLQYIASLLVVLGYYYCTNPVSKIISPPDWYSQHQWQATLQGYFQLFWQALHASMLRYNTCKWSHQWCARPAIYIIRTPSVATSSVWGIGEQAANIIPVELFS